ncbi:MAG TPA: hypothetical protein VIG30_16910 [Ktedonobacterales bacterium]
MSEEQMLPNVPNSPPWSGDPNAPNAPDPSDPQWGGQVGVGGGVDQTTGPPASPYEGPGYQGTRDPQPGGPGGDANLGQAAGASDPNAGSGAGTDQDTGRGGGSSGYGGPVAPGGDANMPSTDSGQGDTGYVQRNGDDEQDDVSGASQDSFPASDPPSFNPGRP